MEERKTKSGMCDCGCCGMMGHGGTRMLFRLLLVLIILAMVFWFGLKLGELRSEIYYGYGSRYSMNPYQEMPMMRVGYSPNAAASPTAVSPIQQ